VKITVAVDYGKGSEIVTASPMAIIGWEKENGTKISNLASEGIGLSDLAELAYRQLKLEGKVTGTLDEFERSLIDLDPVMDDSGPK
jgi:hypothetical protein